MTQPTSAVCRMSLRRMDEGNERMTPQTDEDHAALNRLRVEADAWRACLKAAGWEEQHPWAAG